MGAWERHPINSDHCSYRTRHGGRPRKVPCRTDGRECCSDPCIILHTNSSRTISPNLSAKTNSFKPSFAARQWAAVSTMLRTRKTISQPPHSVTPKPPPAQPRQNAPSSMLVASQSADLQLMVPQSYLPLTRQTSLFKGYC